MPDATQFLGLPGCPLPQADVVVLPVPLERTVSYGRGTEGGPRAILEASCQVETFDEETLVDFEQHQTIHTLPPLTHRGEVTDYLAAIAARVRPLREKFVLALGGEHTLTFGTVTGLIDEMSQVCVVQIDAHADLIDQLDSLHWSHGTVMRRLWERGCRLVQIGVRSLSRSEYELIATGERITTFFAHRLAEQWPSLLALLHGLEGKVYLSVDVDGLDPSVIPSTGAPQPGGLSWPQAIQIIHAVAAAPQCRLVGADLVELIPSPHPPGCDIIAAKLAAKIVALRRAAKKPA